ncbi:MAG: recombination-associated protein RdgC [Deltaproteobacteria bacterium]|jgi:DNA recombination-dependent growth factor C|nr:recombination-associated protein RdgC [Deltaproteobacteria bacterium]
MGLLKGNPSITRYRILDALPSDYTPDFIGERLRKHSFVEIDSSADESSVGWVELFNEFSTRFPLEYYSFASNYSFTMRVDSRKLSTKILSRYYNIRESLFMEKNGRKPNSRKKKEMKETLKVELLRRTLLTTDLYEVVWFVKNSEVWLFATGEKLRSSFEDLFGASFNLNMRLLVPISLGLELSGDDERAELMRLAPSILSMEE